MIPLPPIPLILNRKAGRKSLIALGLEKWLIRAPHSAREAAWSNEQIENEILRVCRNENLNICLHKTLSAGHAKQIAQDLIRQGARVIAVAGGDGTVNEVINAAIGSETSLGIIPLGTANAFAIELGIPLSIQEALGVIKRGQIRTIDAGKAGQHYFAMGASMSYEAHVIKKISPGFKYLFGAMAYIFQGIAESFSYPFPLLKVKIDHEENIIHSGYLVIVANARFYGGHFRAAPDARMDDGLLDVLIMRKKKLGNLLKYMSTMRYGDITKLPDVEYLQCRRFQIDSEKQVPVHVDAEIRETTPCVFECIPNALRIIVPPLC
jgi:YegS/Rv2252/BmrU family lipid kinase